MSANFEAFLKLDTSRYANQYMVLVKRRVVGSGHDLSALLKRIRKKYPRQRPLIAKIPHRGMLV